MTHNKDIIYPRGFKVFKKIPQTPVPESWRHICHRMITEKNWKQASTLETGQKHSSYDCYLCKNKVLKVPLRMHLALPLLHTPQLIWRRRTLPVELVFHQVLLVILSVTSTCVSTPPKTTSPTAEVWISSSRISAPPWEGGQHREGRRTWTSSWTELCGWGRMVAWGNFFSHNSHRDRTGSSGSQGVIIYTVYTSVCYLFI